MQEEQCTAFVNAAETALRTAKEHHPLSLAALYWATVGSSRATLAVAEELRRTRDGERTTAENAATAPPCRPARATILMAG